MLFLQCDEVCVVMWFDKKAVLLFTPKRDGKPNDKCKQWFKKKNKKQCTEIPRSVIVTVYDG